MRLTLHDICTAIDCSSASLPTGTGVLRPAGASMDSREEQHGKLFFCIKGERSDGHDYAALAAEKGALAIIAEHDPFVGQTPPVPVLLTENSVTALGLIAAAERQRTEATVIGVTGSSGKTSVKESIASVLEGIGVTAKNHKNFNNQIGLPLSILNAEEDAVFWVMEAGISESHDMDALGSILRPDIALIINVGVAHLQGLGDKGVAYYKARLLHFLSRGGKAVISADYPDLERESRAYGHALITFSTKEGAAPYTARYKGMNQDGTGKFAVTAQGITTLIEAPFAGEYGAENMAAIAAVVYSLGYAARDMQAGLKQVCLPAGRFVRVPVGPYLVIDDSYNANPLSMNRSVKAAADAARQRGEPLFLILGEMRELGLETESSHITLGHEIAAAKPGWVIWRGGQAGSVEQGVRDAGYTGNFVPVNSVEAFCTQMKRLGMQPGVYLFKGSRGNVLEQFVDAFQKMALSEGEKDAL